MPSAVPANGADEPLAKRLKLSNGDVSKGSATGTKSRIFAPFRTLGLVSPTAVPFISIPLGKTTFQISTSVGRCLQTYDLRRGLNLVFLSRPETPEPITATFAWKDRVFAAWGGEEPGVQNGIWVFKRGKKIGELELPELSGEGVKQILCFGSWIVACRMTRIEVWKTATYEHYTTLTLHSSRNGVANETLLGPICTMPTFLNKVFVGRQDGSVEIWNLSTGKLIYTLLPLASHLGSVTALQPTPAFSLLAIAYSNGSITVHDVRLDTDIITLNASLSQRASITAISFRTDGLGAGDGGREAGVMATAGSHDGDITFWDLNGGGRLMGTLRGAHDPPSDVHGGVAGGISKVEFLPGQPVLVSSGLDNSLKSWIFDETPYTPIPRILHSRSGHAAPVTKLAFLSSDADGADAVGKWLLSAGKDRSLWGWSLRRDGQSTELSQGNIRKRARKLGTLGDSLAPSQLSNSIEELRAPEITCLASSLNRDGGMGTSIGAGSVWANTSSGKRGADASGSGATGWESIVTGHKGDKFARTWFWGRKRAGRWAFETGDGGEVKSVAVTQCGTFALIGSSNGGIDMFNLQSGIHRQRFPPKLTVAQMRKLKVRQASSNEFDSEHETKPKKFGLGEGKHTKAVTGIMVDGLNRTTITCGLDGKVKFWDFATGTLQDEIDWYPMTAITGSHYYRPSDLVALGCDDLSIRVVDIVTKKLVRELWGCAGQISDFCFSNDGRWIVAASMDSIIRVWDLPTGHLIDAIRLDSTCTALAFSSTGEFLATAHVNGVGINVWNNRSLFTHVATRNISDEEIAKVPQPTASGEGGQSLIEAAFDQLDDEDSGMDGLLPTSDQLSKDIMSLSLVPKSRWQTLLHLDVIKHRNKPKEPPKAPEKAPFFLPTLENARALDKPANEDTQVTAADRSRVRKMDRNGAESEFTTLLRSGGESGDYSPFITHLKTLSPAAADIEIRSLNPLQPYVELTLFVSALASRLRQKRDYELVQAWMAVFLRIHGEMVTQDESLVEALKEWRAEQETEAKRLNGLVGYCAGVVGFLRSARI
ncbi:MAG: hypothetical protein M1830_000196 [Pleopsidium flavum]|nr:MAG: hypothetical protein M1830_000196 [Pleopsidium flavum]